MRTCRELNDDVREKISRSMTGMKKSETHRKRISDGMKRYWETIPSKGGGSHEEG